MKGKKTLKKSVVLFLLLILALTIAGCKSDAPGGEIQLGREFDFTGVTKISLTNAHNGNITFITEEEDIAEITAFVGETVGKNMGSGKGYYEGSYSLSFYDENGAFFSLGYGDSDCFYMGAGEDGYPVRYILCHINISDDVIPFFSQFDQSGR